MLTQPPEVEKVVLTGQTQALYTVLHVLPTLAAVEDTSATIQDEVEKSEEAVTLNEKSGHNLPASLDVKEDEYHLFLDLQRYVIGLPEFSIQQPVSSSIGSMIQAFGTVGEDVVRGGTWYSAYNIARNLGMLLSFLCFPSWLAISTLIPMNLLLLRAHTYWRHSVISAHINPSHLRLARGSSMVILKYSPGTWLSFKATALPMSLYSLAICAWLFFGDFDINTLSSSLELIKAFRPIDLLGILVGLVATAAMWGLVIFPTMVVLIRVQASLLPDGEKTVVPFDRTFGVKRARARGYLTTVEAFRSVSWSKWVHLEMVFFKCAFLALGAMGLWLLVVGAEICALKGLYRYYGLL